MIRLKHRQDHIDRIKKIKHRKPGSSPTIDCTAPQLLDPTIAENRKAGRKALNGLIIERENKLVMTYILHLDYLSLFILSEGHCCNV